MQLIRTRFLLLNYSKLYTLYQIDNNSDMNSNLYSTGKCGDPIELTNALAVGYVDPALEGQTITFTCPPGQIHNGSNSSICMGNGKWEPDPREVVHVCTGGMGTTGATTPGMSALNVMIILRLS
jgi:hypothetical protein